MNNKHAARVSYYEGIRRAAEEQFRATEDGLRKLEGLKPSQIEKLVADVHKRHEKLLNRIDRQLREARAHEDGRRQRMKVSAKEGGLDPSD